MEKMHERDMCVYACIFRRVLECASGLLKVQCYR